MKNFQNKIRIIKVSKIIRHILFAGVVLWAIGIPIVFLNCLLKTPTVTGLTRLNLQGGFLLVMLFQLLANFQLFRFFDRLQRGFLFDKTTVGHLKVAGQWFVVLWFYEVFHAILNSQIHVESTGWIWNPSTLFAGLILIFFAWLLKEAQDLQEEQELTV